MVYKKRPRIFSLSIITIESEKEKFGKVRDSYIFTQPGGQTTQSPTHSTTSHEQQMIQTNKYSQKDKEEDIFHIFREIKKKN